MLLEAVDVSAAFGNDKYSFGFSRNDDDNLSFLQALTAEWSAWKVTADIRGYTNRGWKTGWSVNDSTSEDSDETHFYSGRLDTVGLSVSYAWHRSLQSFTFSLSPGGGFILSGNLAQSLVQNTFHRLSNVRQLDLDYDYTQIRVHPFLFLDGGVSFSPVSFLSLSIEGKAYSAYGLASSSSVLLSLSAVKEGRELFSLFSGWRWRKNLSPSPTLALYTEYAEGPNWGFSFDFGFLSVDYAAQIMNHTGTGTLVFHPLEFFEPAQWKKSDVLLTTGFSRLIGIMFQEQNLEIPLGPVSLVFRNRYIAGYPASWERDGSLNTETEGRIRQGYAMNTAGLSWSFSLFSSWVRPFFSFTIGCMKWEVTENRNMMPSSSVPSRPYVGSGAAYSFVIDFETGASIIPDGLLSFSDVTLSVVPTAGVAFVSGDFVSAYRNVSEGRGENEEHPLDGFLFHWGILLSFGLDL